MNRKSIEFVSKNPSKIQSRVYYEYNVDDQVTYLIYSIYINNIFF
jgi:hypothetical protein